MFKHLLVHSTGSERERSVVQTALRAADPSSSHIGFLHVRMDVRQVIIRSAGGGLVGPGSITDLEQIANENERRARDGFQACCSGLGLIAENGKVAGVSASWTMVTGDEEDQVAAIARTSDVVVLGREREDDFGSTAVIEGALMSSGRPVLIAPSIPPANLLTKVAIAWKDTPEAARAVTAAMPLIERAEKVVVLCVAEDGNDEDPSGQRLLEALQWHNANVSKMNLPRRSRSTTETLMEAVMDKEGPASLLVMGGYGHTRLREAVFGGFTRHMLTKADIAVLMSH